MPTSEQDFLAAIDRHFPDQPTGAGGLLLGRGDDCAILDPLGPLCVSTDLFVEGAHFRRSYFSPADIGHKALAAAASDLAAMGAAPVACMLSLVLPDDVDDAFLDGLLAGMAALSARLGLPLIGGDLSRGPALILDLAVFGRPGPGSRVMWGDKMVCRSCAGACAGVAAMPSEQGVRGGRDPSSSKRARTAHTFPQRAGGRVPAGCPRALRRRHSALRAASAYTRSQCAHQHPAMCKH